MLTCRATRTVVPSYGVPPSDAQLLSSSTPEDFGAFYERHVNPVAAYLARRTRRPDILLDLVAETFARAFEHRHRFDPRRGPAAGWLFTIARGLVADAERHGQVSDAARVRLGMPPVVLGEEALARVTERSRLDFITSLAHLPESQRIVVIRRVLGEMEYPELPGHVSCSASIRREPPPQRRLAGFRREAR
jgi:DNA-directed RNA polymerase specialized sigma24 family protein